MDEVISKRLSVANQASGHRYQLFIKRVLDILIAGGGIIILSPVIVIIALAIKLDSLGPVFYKHRRVGKNGEPFNLIKFRSMVSGGDDTSYMNYLQELIESSENGKGKPYQKMVADPRVTRVGHFLRKFYLDEFPQLWNILIGDMSLVGPRPHVQFEVDHYPQEYRRRLSVKPGATGLWQVRGKSDCSFHELLELDLEYVNHWSLKFDFQLIVLTILIMLRGGDGSWARMNKTVPTKEHHPG